MVPGETAGWRRLLAVCLLVAVAVVIASNGIALPAFSDHTGPTAMNVTSFERVGAGCEEQVQSPTSSSVSGDTYERMDFVRTQRADANLSVRVERTSPMGTDLSSFRVHVESHSDGQSNETCQMGVRYRLRVTTSGGSPAGLVPDAHGTRVLWVHNGRYAGCTASITSPLDAECRRFVDRTPETWANASRAG